MFCEIAPSTMFVVVLYIRFNRLIAATDPQQNSDPLFCNNCTDFCQWQTFDAKCRPDEVIIITHALYGRMNYGRCVKRDYGYVGCYVDVRDLADMRCSGKNKCKITVPDQLFDGKNPCPEDLKLYLTASFKCIKVKSLTPSDHSTLPILHYLSSVTSTTCGTLHHPWIVKVQTGQRINVTLLDFTSAATHDKSAIISGARQSPMTSGCQVLAVVKEMTPTTKTVTVCGGQLAGADQERVVYVSETNLIEVRMMMSSSRMSGEVGEYLIKCQAIGCADVRDQPLNGWWRRDKPGGASMGCDDSAQVHAMTCDGNTWSDDVINCTNVPMSSAVQSITRATAMLTVVGIATVVGIVVAVAGICIIRQRHRLCFAAGHSSTEPEEASKSCAQHKTNYSASVISGDAADYFKTNSGIPPPYCGGGGFSGYKESVRSNNGSDGNEYAYVDDFPQCGTLHRSPNHIQCIDQIRFHGLTNHNQFPSMNSTNPKERQVQIFDDRCRRTSLDLHHSNGCQQEGEFLNNVNCLTMQSPCHQARVLSSKAGWRQSPGGVATADRFVLKCPRKNWSSSTAPDVM